MGGRNPDGRGISGLVRRASRRGRSLLLAAAWFVVSGAACQAQKPEPAKFYPIDPLPEYAAAWYYVGECAKPILDTTRHLEDVKWFIRDTLPEDKGTPNPIIGQYVFPDSIFLTVGYRDTLWVVAHELLHYRLGIFNVPTEPHPWIPFAFPCKLMAFQQTLAGIMGPAK